MGTTSPYQGGQQASTYSELDEHAVISGVAGKKVFSVDSTGEQIDNGINIPAHDYISLAQATLTDTWTFKTGGASGTTVATVTITYTSDAKSTISSVART